jgi:hypothetical protein
VSRALFAAAVALLSCCKDRGTISIPLIEPCDARTATQVAIYLKPATTCAAVVADEQTCGLADLECADDCAALCEDGYCDLDALRDGLTFEPSRAGDYALIMAYRYGADATRDEGLACFDLRVDSDGTQSFAIGREEGLACCVP